MPTGKPKHLYPELYEKKTVKAEPPKKLSKIEEHKRLQDMLEEELKKIPQVLGTKHDQEKLKWSLMPSGAIEDLLAVLQHGANKYAPNNWQKVENAYDRYYDAAMRHISAWRSGELLDEESNLSHLSHAIVCLTFLDWFEGNGYPDDCNN